MFRTSETTAKLDAALAKAQSQIETASKDKVNPAFKSKYADLTAVWDACRTALTANGISVSQWPVHSEDNRLHLITRLACQGEWMLAEFSIPADKQNAHGYGSAITYCKRFGLSAAIGVVADEDDDGNAASAKTNGGNQPTPPVNSDSYLDGAAKGKTKATGKLNITALKQAMREFSRDMEACSDIGELDGLLAASRELLDQCEVDLKDWYFGKDDAKGAQLRISERIAELTAAPHNMLKAG